MSKVKHVGGMVLLEINAVDQLTAYQSRRPTDHASTVSEPNATLFQSPTYRSLRMKRKVVLVGSHGRGAAPARNAAGKRCWPAEAASSRE